MPKRTKLLTNAAGSHRTRVMSVIGTRPEAIKMAPVIKALQAHPESIESVVVSTAQHREMLDQVLSIFHILPDHDLNLMRPNQSVCGLAIRTIEAMDALLRTTSPDLLLVQGDTSTTFAAALAAFYCKVPVGHVEAGLRSHAKFNPYPEEGNRRLTTTLADYHFAPTSLARSNLLAEGVMRERIVLTGNTIVDALAMMAQEAPGHDDAFSGLPDLEGRRMLLVTAHRRENWGQPLNNICLALRELVGRYQDLAVVFPVHLNPNVRQTVQASLAGIDRIHLIEPLDYLAFLRVMKQATVILTDSGGIQEEAPSLGKPVLVLRATTERPEAADSGMARIVGTDQRDIVESTAELLDHDDIREGMTTGSNPYGDGRAAERIVSTILTVFGGPSAGTIHRKGALSRERHDGVVGVHS